MQLGAEARRRLASLPVFVLVLPWRCNLAVPPQVEPLVSSALDAKQEARVARVTSAPPPAEPPRRPSVTLAEEVVVKALGAGQPAFLRCWARAQRLDPGLSSPKVRLHLEVDELGKVTAATSDSQSPPLARCLSAVARQLPFPPPGQRAVVDVPLMFP